MGNWKAKENFTLQLEITMWANSDLIKRKAEEFILGLAKKAMFMRDNSKQEKEMGEVLSGGQMVAGMREISGMVCKVGGECSTEKEGTVNIKVTGITVCSMEKAPNISKTASDMRALLSKTSSTVKVYFTKTTRLFMECGRTTSCRW